MPVEAKRLIETSSEREPDRYAAGLRFTGKWVLRLGIVLMGLLSMGLINAA